MRLSNIIRLSVAAGLSLVLHAGILGGFGPVVAQSNDNQGLDFLTKASKAYEAGTYTDAAGYIDEAFKAGLSKELAARAILIRAQVNERSGALARALQDYSNALWMDTLSPSERRIAWEGKHRIIAAMGLNTPAPGSSKPASVASGGSSIPHSDAGSSSGGVFSVFSGLFGSSNASRPPEPPAPARPTAWQTGTAASAAVVRVPSAPENTPRAVKHAAAPRPAHAEKVAALRSAPMTATLQPVSTGSVDSPADGFLIVFGTVANEAAGHSKAQQIKAQLSDILVSRNLDVPASPGGGFQIVAGPYKAKSAALALCSAMKQRGVNCRVTP